MLDIHFHQVNNFHLDIEDRISWWNHPDNRHHIPVLNKKKINKSQNEKKNWLNIKPMIGAKSQLTRPSNKPVTMNLARLFISEMNMFFYLSRKSNNANREWEAAMQWNNVNVGDGRINREIKNAIELYVVIRFFFFSFPHFFLLFLPSFVITSVLNTSFILFFFFLSSSALIGQVYYKRRKKKRLA
jgi:hypothetical protein